MHLMMAMSLQFSGGIQGDRLDVWMHDRAAAKRWGRRKVKVRVLQ